MPVDGTRSRTNLSSSCTNDDTQLPSGQKNQQSVTLEAIMEKLNNISKTMATKNDLDVITKKVQVLETKVSKLSSDVASCVSSNEELDEKFSASQQEINDLKMSLTRAERYTRQYSFKINGLPDNKDEDTVKVVCTFMEKELGIPDPEDIIEIAHRLQSKVKPRPIIVRCYSRVKKSEIIVTSKKELASQSKIYLQDDLTKYDYEQKKKLKPVMEAAFKAGKKVKFSSLSGKLYIDGKVYNP